MNFESLPKLSDVRAIKNYLHNHLTSHFLHHSLPPFFNSIACCIARQKLAKSSIFFIVFPANKGAIYAIK